MTKMFESSMEENEKNDLAIINALTQSEPFVETLIKRQQTCKKSTSGLLKYSNLNFNQQQQSHIERRTNSRSISNDSSINLNGENELPSPQPGLKLVLKRASGSSDKYEVKNNNTMYHHQLSMSLNEKMFANQPSSSGTRPKREASRKVKFIFKDYETDFDNLSSARKRLKLTIDPLSNSMNESQTSFNTFIRQNSFSTTPQTINSKIETQTNQIKFKASPLNSSIFFNSNEIMNASEEDKLRVLKCQPKVVIHRSVPLPIALVEDKTNVVYTKALLFLHLFVSYLAPCIQCPWCNRYLNVSEFSKHLHIDQMDDDDEEEEDDDDDADDEDKESVHSSSDEMEFKTDEERQTFMARRRRKKKFLKLVKKSFKILPYCVNSNEELSEQEIKRWKLFGDKFSTFKQKHLKHLKEQQALSKTQAKDHEKIPNKIKEVQIKKFNDWDHIDQNGNFFIIEKERLVADSVVYLENENASESIHLIDEKMEEESKVTTNKDIRRSNSDDVFLSEDEEKEGDIESSHKTKKKSSSSSSKTTPINVIETIDENQVSNSKSISHFKKPSLIQSFFNLYDNLPRETLIYINKNQFTIVPISFLNYCDAKRQLKLKRLKLAKTNQLKIIWLCLTLDLEC